MRSNFFDCLWTTLLACVFRSGEQESRCRQLQKANDEIRVQVKQMKLMFDCVWFENQTLYKNRSLGHFEKVLLNCRITMPECLYSNSIRGLYLNSLWPCAAKLCA